MPYFTQRQSCLVLWFFFSKWELIALDLTCTNRKFYFFEKQRKWKQEMKEGKKNKGRKLVYWRGGVCMVWSLPFLTFKKNFGENCPKQWKHLIQDMDASCKHATLTRQILPLIQNVHPSRRSYFFPLAIGSALKMRTDVIREMKLYIKH